MDPQTEPLSKSDILNATIHLINANGRTMCITTVSKLSDAFKDIYRVVSNTVDEDMDESKSSSVSV